MSEEIFAQYSSYYDLLYQDKDYEAEAAYVAGVLRATDSGIRELLEFGSGTGRHGRLMAQHGIRVFGVERSEFMVALASQQRPTHPLPGDGVFECVRGDIRNVQIDRVFDSVVALFHVLSYQTRNDDVLRTFSNAARHLRPNGVFLFDVWHGPAVLGMRPSIRVKRVEDERTRLIRIAEPTLDTRTSVVKVRYTMLAEDKIDGHLTSFHEEHEMRYFFPVEIELLAKLNGFELVRCEEFQSGRPPSEATWGVAYLVRKSV